jgi:hypothetical protein
MSEFSHNPVFSLDEGTSLTLKVSVTHDAATGKPLSVCFSDPNRDQMVSVDADLWERVVAAVARGWEY